jgi:hypothetical protein
MRRRRRPLPWTLVALLAGVPLSLASGMAAGAYTVSGMNPFYSQRPLASADVYDYGHVYGDVAAVRADGYDAVPPIAVTYADTDPPQP